MVEVAFNGPGVLEHTTFTYSVPDHLKTSIAEGQLVFAPFRTSHLPGIVTSLTVSVPTFPVRELKSLFDQRPVILPPRVSLAKWMSEKYLAPLPTVLALFLPWGKRLKVIEAYTTTIDAIPSDLAAPEARVLSSLMVSGPLTPQRLAKKSTVATVKRHIRALMAKGMVERVFVPDMGEELSVEAGASLETFHHQGPNVEHETDDLPSGKLPDLSPRAHDALASIDRHMRSGTNKALSFCGLDSAERLAIYLRLIRSSLRSGSGVLALFPEIASVERSLAGLANVIGRRAAVLHSGLSPKRAYGEWLRLWQGEARVALGVRVAVFAPVRDLSLIIVDEEAHETYKSPQAISYNARDVALKLSQLSGATILFGSTVPSMWLQAAVHRGDVTMLTTSSNRPVTSPRKLEVIDLRRSRPTKTVLSGPLLRAIADTTSSGHQAIILINRRGTASLVLCGKCGNRISCSKCDGPMTYHQSMRVLLCHRCGTSRAVPSFCEVCGAKDFRYLGAGTERVASELNRFFPTTPVLRFDRDTAPSITEQSELLEAFRHGRWSILVGTGLALDALEAPAVNLVALLLPDIILHLPDIDASERVFHTLYRVALWCERRPHGKAFIETYSPDHHAIWCGVKADYRCFFSREASVRQERGYPPFGDLIRLLYTSSSEATCQREARALAETLEAAAVAEGMQVSVMGPTPAFWHKLGGKYRWHILVKGRDAHRLIGAVDIHRGWHIDVDPVTIL